MKKKNLIYYILSIFILSILALIIYKPVKDTVYVYSDEINKYNKIFKIEAKPNEGFYWPYLLYIPANLENNTENVSFLVIPNNTSVVTDDDYLQEKETIEELKRELPGPYQDKRMKYVLLQPIFPRTRSRFVAIDCPHSLDRSVLLAKSKNEHIAIKIIWQGGELSENSKMIYDLNNIFVVQNNLIYNCVAADFNPKEAFDEGNHFEMELYIKGGWDYKKPFNLIENFEDGGGFLFKNLFKDKNGQVHNGKLEENNSLFKVVSIKKLEDEFIEVWNNEGKKLILNEFKRIERIDLQLIAMIDHAKNMMEKEKGLGLAFEDKITMWGFSASGDFVDRFCFLHPDKVKAAVIGGSNIMLPLEGLEGEKLPYPLGIYDYKKITGREFNIKQFSKIDRYIYKGENDKGGWYSSNGKKIPAEDYHKEHFVPIFKKNNKSPVITDGNINKLQEEEIRYRIFGNEVSVYKRFQEAKKIYEDMRIVNHRFKIYKNIGHEITEKIQKDMLEFLIREK